MGLRKLSSFVLSKTCLIPEPHFLPSFAVLVDAVAQVSFERTVERLLGIVHRLCHDVFERGRIYHARISELVDEKRVVFWAMNEIDEFVRQIIMRRVLQNAHTIEARHSAFFRNEKIDRFFPARFVHFAVDDFGIALTKPKVA